VYRALNSENTQEGERGELSEKTRFV